MRLYITLAFFILYNSIVFSQNDYTPLKCKGTIPADFLTSSKVKYLQDKSTIDRKEKNRVRKDKDNFYIYTNYKIDFLLRSGMVLFGDETTEYVNSVGKYVLKDFPELKNKIRFYVLKSPEVNASSTYQGIIFVNLGLLAQVENEAQLAYILSHEIIHYKNEHVMKSYLNTKDIVYGRGQYKKLSLKQNEHAYFDYSKENEMEADALGLKDFYLKTNYEISEVLNVFDVLLYSYLPIDEIPFDTTYFNDEFFTLPTKYFKKELDPISAIEDFDDSKSTHPNIKKRREKIYEIVADLDDQKERKKYVISEEKFKSVQKQARFEMSQLYLTNTQYDKSFYNTFLLLRQYPNSLYLKKKMAYALYGFSKFSNYKSLSRAITGESKYEGEIQQIPHFFRKLKRINRTELAIKYAWKQYEESKDNYFKTLVDDLMYDLFKFESKTPSYFITIASAEKDDFKEISHEEYLKLSKYKKIKYDKEKKKYSNKGEKDVWKYIFATELQNEDFNKSLVSAYDKVMEDKKEDYVARKRRKRIALGVDSITIVEPTYEIFLDDEKKYVKSEDRKAVFTKQISKNAKRAKLNVEQQNICDLNSSQVDKFNEISTFNFWLYEYFNQQDNLDNIWNIIPSQQDYVKPLIKDYRYLAMTGVISKNYRRSVGQKIGSLFLSLMVVPIPYAVYVFTSKRHYTNYYIILFDMKEGKYIYRKISYLKTKDFKYVLNMNLYDAFHKIKLKPKKRN